MREHLFRGFHPDENGKTEITLNGEKIKGEWVEGLPFERDAQTNEINSIRADIPGTYLVYFVLPETVSEYTGLTDRNDKKIFEGDILLINVESERLAKAKRKERHITQSVVVFEAGGFTLSGGELVLFTYYGLKCLHKPSSFKNYEVIGNIHENPELLDAQSCATCPENNNAEWNEQTCPLRKAGACKGGKE